MSWRQDNTEGYTDQQLDDLNDEFERRWDSGEWAGADRDEAEKWFSDEVAGR